MLSRVGFQAARVEGVRELVKAFDAIDPSKGLRKELGQENKEIGRDIIARSFPKPIAVGQGAGAIPRPSATSTILRIVAGGAWRRDRRQQWGKRTTDRKEKRPYIRRAAERMMPEIEDRYVKAILKVANKAGFETER